MSGPSKISPERKAAYYIGMGVSGLGVLLFLSNFFVVANQASDPFGMMARNPMPGFVARAIGGMILMVVGQVISRAGARGAAGSGLILDPEQAREDLKPWAQAAGGIVKDALGEIKAPTAPAPAAPAPEPEVVVKVKCPDCHALNDEDARFCKQCGKTL